MRIDAVRRDCEAFVVVNNKAEGSAPLTIRALAETLVGKMSKDTADLPNCSDKP